MWLVKRLEVVAVSTILDDMNVRSGASLVEYTSVHIRNHDIDVDPRAHVRLKVRQLPPQRRQVSPLERIALLLSAAAGHHRLAIVMIQDLAKPTGGGHEKREVGRIEVQ